MIVKWAQERIKVIPKTDNMGSVILAPGYNEVEDSNWKFARPRVMNQIEKGDIVEEWVKVNFEQVADYAITIKDEKSNNLAPAKLKDINRPRVKDVVKATYHIPTLERWLDEELRQDVRIEILRQLSEIDRGNTIEHKKNLAATLDRVK